MNKTLKIYGVILLVVIAILAILEVNKSEVLDWRKNYDIRKKTPFGLFVFHQEAKYLFNNKLEETDKSPFDYYRKNKNSQPHNIFIFDKNLDHESWKKILSEVEKGSDVLMFSNEIDYNLKNTLDIQTYHTHRDSISLYFTDVKLSHQSIIIDKLPSTTYFSYLPKKHKILGYSEGENFKKIGANFAEIPFGKGRFLFHLEPLVVTNYYLLKPENEKYAQSVFAHLPDRKTIWFTENYKTKEQSHSPLRFILDNAGLRYAWWLFLGGLLLFIFFNAKRKQRIVPIIEPPKNKSVEFVKSIGNLYLQEGSARDMAQKKIQYFLHKVRTELMIDTQHLDDVFIKKLHTKTGKPIEKITEIVEFIKKTENSLELKREELIKINHLLNEILK